MSGVKLYSIEASRRSFNESVEGALGEGEEKRS